jgi:hypothetical protein
MSMSASDSLHCFKLIRVVKPIALSEIYVRFLNLARAVRELPDFPSLDPVEERLLNLLAGIWQQGQRISVLQVMGLSDEVSSTTTHRRIKSLRLKGMVTLLADEADNRIKYVLPTPLANHYLAQLGQCVEQARQA